MATMNQWLATMCLLPLWVDDHAKTIVAIRASVRRHVRIAEAHGAPLRLVVLDYLQLVRSGAQHKSRNEELTEVCRQVTEMRAEHPEVSFVILAQLNRESSDGRKPRDSDLRECGQVEQDADTIALLWCPDKNDADLVEMTFAKNRGLRRDLSPRFRVSPRSVGWKRCSYERRHPAPAVRGHLTGTRPLPRPRHLTSAPPVRRGEILWLPGLAPAPTPPPAPSGARASSPHPLSSRCRSSGG